MKPNAKLLDGRRILVFEDDPILLEMVREVLEDEGALVEGRAEPDSGDAGGAFDLLVADVVLPGRSGIDLAADLARARPALRVLLMSGFGDPEIAARDRIPAYDSLIKPFLPEDLVAKAYGLLHRPS